MLELLLGILFHLRNSLLVYAMDWNQSLYFFVVTLFPLAHTFLMLLLCSPYSSVEYAVVERPLL